MIVLSAKAQELLCDFELVMIHLGFVEDQIWTREEQFENGEDEYVIARHPEVQW